MQGELLLINITCVYSLLCTLIQLLLEVNIKFSLHLFSKTDQVLHNHIYKDTYM